jgi:hypothetical protein
MKREPKDSAVAGSEMLAAERRAQSFAEEAPIGLFGIISSRGALGGSEPPPREVIAAWDMGAPGERCSDTAMLFERLGDGTIKVLSIKHGVKARKLLRQDGISAIVYERGQS